MPTDSKLSNTKQPPQGHQTKQDGIGVRGTEDGPMGNLLAPSTAQCLVHARAG